MIMARTRMAMKTTMMTTWGGTEIASGAQQWTMIASIDSNEIIARFTARTAASGSSTRPREAIDLVRLVNIVLRMRE